MNIVHPVTTVAFVLVVVNGMFVPSAPVATLHQGRVVGPLELVARFTDRIDAGSDGSVTVTRGDRACGTQPLAGFAVATVPLAALVRCLGGSVTWDSHAKTLVLAFGGETLLRTMAPFDPSAPQAPPTTVFTPEPAPATPRAIVTGAPRPRRTPIPAIPSWPLRTATPSATPAAGAL